MKYVHILIMRGEAIHMSSLYKIHPVFRLGPLHLYIGGNIYKCTYGNDISITTPENEMLQPNI